MYTLIFIFAVVFILLAAYTFVTSSGDEKKVEKAKKQIWYAVIAVAVALLSVSFTVLIQNFLFDGGGGGANPGNTCDTNPNLPGCAL
jgi:amino acid transporter